MAVNKIVPREAQCVECYIQVSALEQQRTVSFTVIIAIATFPIATFAELMLGYPMGVG